MVRHKWLKLPKKNEIDTHSILHEYRIKRYANTLFKKYIFLYVYGDCVININL